MGKPGIPAIRGPLLFLHARTRPSTTGTARPNSGQIGCRIIASLEAEPLVRVFGELRRRNVFKVSVAYAVLSWLLVKLVDALSPVIGAGDRVIQIVTLLLILGFPVIVLFAWACELTPEGVRPTSSVEKSKSITAETGRKLNVVLATLLVIAAIVFAAEKYI